MNSTYPTDTDIFRKTILRSGARKVAFVFHLKTRDRTDYAAWLDHAGKTYGGKRLFRVKPDPVARKGMLLDEILIQEYPSAQVAFTAWPEIESFLKHACVEYVVLAIEPEPRMTFRLVRFVSWCVRLFKKVTDKGTPGETWNAENTAVWPDEKQMRVALRQNLDAPLLVYNLNKYRPFANYKDSDGNNKLVSGEKAYARYAKIAGFELLRRGAYPVYGGKPLCVFGNVDNSMLIDRLDHFTLVRYPQRRNLLAMLEGDEFHKGEVHRDAGLERVAIFMATEIN